MDFFKRQLPTLLVLVLGLGMIIQYYIPTAFSQHILKNVNLWIQIIAAFTLCIGITSLLRTHYTKIRLQHSGWAYSIILYIVFIAMVYLGFSQGIQEGTPFRWLFDYVQTPLSSTTFSLTAFFICSAAYRAFRARTTEATIMLIAAIIVMIGRIPFGDMLSAYLPSFIPGFNDMAGWIFNIPGMAARRAILLGISLGGIATSLRIILGIERSYQGKD